jgi:hypothetical protein
LTPACRRSLANTDSIAAGHVGDPASAITRGEIRALVAQIRTAGSAATDREAFVDLLWQEAERQRLGLPGGDQAPASRRKVILGHGRRIQDGKAAPVRTDPKALPPGTVLTPDGRAIVDSL